MPGFDQETEPMADHAKGAEIRQAMQVAYGGLERLQNLRYLQLVMDMHMTVNGKELPYAKKFVEYVSIQEPANLTIQGDDNGEIRVGFDEEISWPALATRDGMERTPVKEAMREWMLSPMVLLCNDMFNFVFIEDRQEDGHRFHRVRIDHPEDGRPLCELWVDMGTKYIARLAVPLLDLGRQAVVPGDVRDNPRGFNRPQYLPETANLTQATGD